MIGEFEMDNAKHMDFWKKVADESTSRVAKMFSDGGISLKTAIGKDAIDDYDDAKRTMTFVLSHADTSEETACCMLSVCEWLHACNEMRLSE